MSAYECLTREDGEDGLDEIFDSPEDMRDFAATFFESFFGGGFASWSHSGSRGGPGGPGGDRSYPFHPFFTPHGDGEYDSYDSEYTDEDEDDAFGDLRDFFTRGPPPGGAGAAAAGGSAAVAGRKTTAPAAKVTAKVARTMNSSNTSSRCERRLRDPADGGEARR